VEELTASCHTWCVSSSSEVSECLQKSVLPMALWSFSQGDSHPQKQGSLTK